MKPRTDMILLVLTVLFVAGLAIVAGAISFAHMQELALIHAQLGWRSTAFPISVDGLELVSSLHILAQRRAGRRAGPLPWVALLVGTAASLAANVAVGGNDMVGRALAGWPAISLLVSLKLLFSMFDHGSDHRTGPDGHRTVRDDQRTVPDRPPVRGTVHRTGTDDTRPSRPSTASGTGVPGPSAPATRPAPGVPGGPADVRDVADLLPAARAARAALTATGHRLSRDRLADRLREDGHAVSNQRAGLLVKILITERAVTSLGGPGPAAMSHPGQPRDQAA